MEYKLTENVDYEFIPASNDPQAWNIRFITGDFLETVVQYGKIRIDGTDDDPLISFDYKIVTSPITDLTEGNEYLQDHVGEVLVSIIETGIEKKELGIRESK